jgi:hypothetical protein
MNLFGNLIQPVARIVFNISLLKGYKILKYIHLTYFHAILKTICKLENGSYLS